MSFFFVTGVPVVDRREEASQGLGDDVQVALEATYGWEWLADLLEDAGTSSISRIRSGRRRSPLRA